MLLNHLKCDAPYKAPCTHQNLMKCAVFARGLSQASRDGFESVMHRAGCATRAAQRELYNVGRAPFLQAAQTGLLFHAAVEVASLTGMPPLRLPLRMAATGAAACLGALLQSHADWAVWAVTGMGAVLGVSLGLWWLNLAHLNLVCSLVASAATLLWVSPQGHEQAAHAPAPAADVVGCTSWDDRIRRCLHEATGPYASEYRNQGLLRMNDAFGQSTEDMAGACSWLLKLEALLPTLKPLPAFEVTEQETFIATLKKELATVHGYDAIKRRVVQVATRQCLGHDPGAQLFIVGTPGCGKTTFVNAICRAYGMENSLSINCGEIAGNDIAGHLDTYVRAHPSVIAELLMKSPKNYLIVHLEELDKASICVQNTLLSLLERSDRFTDKYFRLPLNKSRLFFIGTMNRTDRLIGALRSRVLPDTFNASPLMTGMGPYLAQQMLRLRLGEAGFAGVTSQAIEAMARELMLFISAQVDGREMDRTVCQVVDTALLVQHERTGPKKLSASIVHRALAATWCDYQKNSASITSPHKWLKLCAVRPVNETRALRWVVPLNEQTHLQVTVCDTQGFRLQMCDKNKPDRDVTGWVATPPAQQAVLRPNEFLTSVRTTVPPVDGPAPQAVAYNYGPAQDGVSRPDATKLTPGALLRLSCPANDNERFVVVTFLPHEAPVRNMLQKAQDLGFI